MNIPQPVYDYIIATIKNEYPNAGFTNFETQYRFPQLFWSHNDQGPFVLHISFLQYDLDNPSAPPKIEPYHKCSMETNGSITTITWDHYIPNLPEKHYGIPTYSKTQIRIHQLDLADPQYFEQLETTLKHPRPT